MPDLQTDWPNADRVLTEKHVAPTWTSVDLGPDLPMPVFTSTEAWNAQRIGALAMYCSDGRWGEAFDEFCHKRLQIPRYDRLALPGGPACLVPQDKEMGFCRGTWENLEFLVRAHKLERIVLITHFGCAYYAEQLKQDAAACLPSQLRDLKTAADALREWFPDLQVEAYLAMRRERLLSFHQINT